MSERVGIDTNIWIYAYVEETSIVAGRMLHEEAKSFLVALLADASRAVALSDYQVHEVMEVMRRVGVAPRIREDVRGLFFTEKCEVVPCSTHVVRQATALSKESGIHVDDYLVALPLGGLVTVIYTADEHFDHPDFRRIARIENPLSWTVGARRGPKSRRPG